MTRFLRWLFGGPDGRTIPQAWRALATALPEGEEDAGPTADFPHRRRLRPIKWNPVRSPRTEEVTGIERETFRVR